MSASLRRYVTTLDPGCTVERDGAEVSGKPTPERVEYIATVLSTTHPWAKVIQ